MTDKLKQIEEMARDIAFEFCPNRNLHKKWGNEAQCYSDDNFSECTTIKNAVDKLYNLGYRKFSEGSVVLSKEEYEKLGIVVETVQEYQPTNGQLKLIKEKKTVKKLHPDSAELIRETARKETTREVLEAIKFFIEERNNPAGEDLEDVMIDGLIFTEVLDEIAKQFGVEVEE